LGRWWKLLEVWGVVKWLSKLRGKFAVGICEVSFVMLIFLKLGIGLWEFGALWEILLGFKVILDFVKSLSWHLSKLVFVNKCEIGGHESWESRFLAYFVEPLFLVFPFGCLCVVCIKSKICGYWKFYGIGIGCEDLPQFDQWAQRKRNQSGLIPIDL
jgi:hypothetical protein